jgi:hypothetical protein
MGKAKAPDAFLFMKHQALGAVNDFGLAQQW